MTRDRDKQGLEGRIPSLCSTRAGVFILESVRRDRDKGLEGRIPLLCGTRAGVFILESVRHDCDKQGLEGRIPLLCTGVFILERVRRRFLHRERTQD